ncbi:MAG: hypothetical protein N5P05_000114 [Chroococcopsis gigantea SAG 12.99]|nr:hypothetical protein [Chroococcopsis gigantea SAG 12.99]
MELVRQLRQLGYDVLTSYEAGQANQAISDEKVLTFAHERERAVITLNREDFIGLHKQGREHSGILIAKEDRDYQGQATIINEFMVTDAQSLKGRLIRIKKQNQKGSPTPIFAVQEY